MTLLPMSPPLSRRAFPCAAALAVAVFATGCGGADEGERQGAGAGVPWPSVSAGPLDRDAPRYGTEPSGPPQPSRDCSRKTGPLVEPSPVDAAMGLRAMGVWLTNCGQRPYRLDGYPAVRVLDADGAAVAVRVLKGAGDITTGVPDPARTR
ncbi:DUF4232 domain-containing protein [Streptomyces sp. G45]|uniref:DUF4232 domain-containing protein n=1 Tax=Streptomyces sp. G45 TaxID=3406627 RepID=UPI003C29315C